MNYASTLIKNGVETVAVVLPLSSVPAFDPDNPPQANTYGVPDDVEIGWIKGIDGVFITPAPPTQGEIVAALTAALEAHYDSKARERKYDNRLTCALRAGYPGPFQAEGTAFAVWMDTCNAYAYQVMADCQNNLRAIPTAAELIAELPELVWPI